MSVSLTDGEQKSAREFIETFAKKTCDSTITDVDKLPTKPASHYCIKDEVKGELQHVALQYLCDSDAPDVVSTTIARLVGEKLSNIDLTSFEVEVTCPKNEDDSDDEDKMPVINMEYDCAKLAIEAVNAVHDICKEWNAKMPTLMKSRMSYEVYAHSEQNTRRKMEDKHIVMTEVNNFYGLDKDFPNQAYFGVYDGHGGIDCASYTVAHFHNNVFKQEVFGSDLDKALCGAFVDTDKEFLEKAQKEGLRSGTTGVVAFLRGNTLHIAWAGDSQITLCKRGMGVNLMQPHKPNRKDERKRIEELGGCVVWYGDWRVNGNIAVSRSIGDRDHKPYVSADADSAVFDLEGDEEYIILGCDGLWDTIAPKDVVPIVQKHLTDGGARSEVAKLLVRSAIEHGSTDNVTVVIVYLDCHMKDVKKSEEQENTKPGGDESADKQETKSATENEG